MDETARFCSARFGSSELALPMAFSFPNRCALPLPARIESLCESLYFCLFTGHHRTISIIYCLLQLITHQEQSRVSSGYN
ncbi:unnamed protein product [Victoria cruziana]